MKKKIVNTSIVAVIISVVIAGCDMRIRPEYGEEEMNIEKAVCVLHPTAGYEVKGTVVFTKSDTGIVIRAEMEGLEPGKHGFHIHELGDCSDPEGKSAGGHFNPYDKRHGAPGDNERHVGDLGNIYADSTGKASLNMIDTVISLNGSNSIIGRAVIVHQGEDDLVSQPTGNAGARVACGIIGIAR
jgi:Cu-Zn family superoxide dismutase